MGAAVPFGSSTGLDPITQGLDASTQGYAPYAAYGAYGYYGKRSADPYYGAYGVGLGYAAAVPFGSSTGLDPITQGFDASTQGYAPYAAYGAYGYYGKRFADAYCAYGAYAGGFTGLDPITQGADPITQGVDPVTQGAVPLLWLSHRLRRHICYLSILSIGDMLLPLTQTYSVPFKVSLTL